MWCCCMIPVVLRCVGVVVGSNDGGDGGMLFAYNGCMVQLDEHSHVCLCHLL
jgi:hypothetical protein